MLCKLHTTRLLLTRRDNPTTPVNITRLFDVMVTRSNFNLFRVLWTDSESTINTSEVEILKEDYTIANLIRRALIKDPNVVFAGAIVKHPLETSVIIKIQTKTKDYTPRIAFENAVKQVKVRTSAFRKAFEVGALSGVLFVHWEIALLCVWTWFCSAKCYCGLCLRSFLFIFRAPLLARLCRCCPDWSR